MQIATTGREYAKWTVTGVDDATPLAVSVDSGATWHPLEWVPETPGVVRVLVAGPDATGNPEGTVVLPKGSARAVIRATDTSEVVLRFGGTISIRAT